MMLYPSWTFCGSLEAEDPAPKTWIRKAAMSQVTKMGVSQRGATQRVFMLQEEGGMACRITRPCWGRRC